jgi:protein-disulfide isomerase
MDQKQKLIYIGIGLVVTTIFLIGVYFVMNDPSQAFKQSGTESTFEITRTVRPEDHTKWSDKNQIILTEYSDLQCPACGSFHTALNGIDQGEDEESKLIRDNITLVFRHYPLQTIHPKALDAAIAAEAAANQGKFFEFLDIAFQNQQEWSGSDEYNQILTDYALSLNVNADQFQRDLEDEATRQKVLSDIQTGETARVNATPTFFLNGARMEYRTFDEFKQQLVDATANARDSETNTESTQESEQESESTDNQATEEGSIQKEEE